MTTQINKSGFTLIELLVVIGIIGILAALITVSFTASQRQARDTQRKSDISQYRSSLEANASKTNGLYPAHSLEVSADALCSTDNIATTCPVDPKNGTSPFGYNYVSDGTSGATATKYTLYTYLENTTTYWVVCSNGTTTTKSSKPSIADCP